MEELASFLQVPVILADPGMATVAASPPGTAPPGRPLELPAGAQSLPPGELMEGRLRRAAGEVPCLLARAAARNRTEGFLILLNPGVMNEEQRDFVLAAAALAGLMLARDRAGEEAARGARSQFLYDLVYNNLESRGAMVELGRLWGWDLTRPHGLVLLALKDFDPLADRRLMQEAATRVASLCGVSRPMLLVRGGQIVIILPADGVEGKDAGKKLAGFARRALDRLAGLFPGRNFTAGIGQTYPSPAELFRSFQEAKLAVELGPVRDPEGQVHLFHELGVIRLIHDLQADRLEEFYRDMLDPLLRYDRENGTDLIPTLHRYFLCGGQLREAARQMYLHPNTLRYRLKKVEELLKVSLDDLETCLNLFTALKAGALLEHREREG